MKRHLRRFTKEEQDNIRHLYYDLEYSVQMVCNKMGTDLKTAHYWIRKFGIPRNRSQAQFVALKYGRKYNPLGAESHLWKGGRINSGYGYIYILLDSEDPFFEMAKQKQPHGRSGYVFEHRYIMAQYLKRSLSGDEFVHHLNGIRTDNRIANLALTHRSNHPTKTLMELLQERIRGLEADLAQQKLGLS